MFNPQRVPVIFQLLSLIFLEVLILSCSLCERYFFFSIKFLLLQNINSLVTKCDVMSKQ